jgi:hypothetical protein
LASKLKVESKEKKEATGLALVPGIDPYADHSKEKKKEATGLALAPGIDPHDQEEKDEIVDPSNSNYHVSRVNYQYHASRVDKEEESKEDDSDSCMVSGTFHIGVTMMTMLQAATYQTEPVDLCLSPPAASSAALLLLQG